MILTHVTIVVKDQNAALEFYTQKMGFEKRADDQKPELTARGVKFKDPQPREEGWGMAADLTDPDGDHFTIHETRRPPATADWAKTSKKA